MEERLRASLNKAERRLERNDAELAELRAEVEMWRTKCREVQVSEKADLINAPALDVRCREAEERNKNDTELWNIAAAHASDRGFLHQGNQFTAVANAIMSIDDLREALEWIARMGPDEAEYGAPAEAQKVLAKMPTLEPR